MSTSAPADAGREFDEYEATGAVPPPAAPPPAAPAAAAEDEAGARPRPTLTLKTLAHPLETVALGDGVYRLRYLFQLSLGRQTGLINAYNAVIDFMRREQVFEELDAAEEAQRRFFLVHLARAALADCPPAAIDAAPVQDLEALAMRFFVRTRELRAEAAEATAGRPTSGDSSPASSASTAATPGAG